MQISIIGAGVVGRATGIGLESSGHNVSFVANISSRLDYLYSQGHVTLSISKAARESDTTTVSVPGL